MPSFSALAPKWPGHRHQHSPNDVVALLAKILAKTPRLPDGVACASQPELFDCDRLDQAAQAVRALDICSQCPSLDRCADWALSDRAGELTGVVGGMWFTRPENNAQRGPQGRGRAIAS